jgi:hypothetical protein
MGIVSPATSWPELMQDDGAAVDPTAPKVVSRTPRLGEVLVDPKLKELRVTFDRDMARSASWVGIPPSFPMPTGNGSWQGRRTSILPVQLEPGRTYCAGINGGRFWNFRSLEQVSAAQDLLLFRTSGGEPLPALTIEDNRTAIQELRRAIDEQYSHRDRLGIDWDAQFSAHRAKLEGAANALEFMLAMYDLLAVTDDQHIEIKYEDAVVPIVARAPDAVFSQRAVAKTMPEGQKVNPAIIMGRFDDGIGYMMITTWRDVAQEELEMLDQVLDILIERDVPALVIDVRPNGGGDETIARHFAGRFIQEKTPYARHRAVDPQEPDGFSQENVRSFVPNNDGPRFTKPVAVLMGGYNMSATESFLLMMRQVDNCTLIGDSSYGSSGNPKAHVLSNGVTVMLPSWIDTDLEGRPIEGQGIKPDVMLRTFPGEVGLRPDPVILRALEILRSN